MAAAGLPSFRWSLLCATATCALTPAYTIRWHIGFYPSTVLEAAIVLSVVAFLLETRRLPGALSWWSPVTLPAVLLLAAGAIAVVVAPDHRAALGLFRAYLIEPLAFFFVVSTVVRTADRAAMVLAGLGLAGVVVAIVNARVVIDAVLHHSLNLAVAPPVAIYMTANAVALFLVPLIAVAASLLLYSSQWRQRAASALFLAISLPAVVLSFSRGGYLALAAIVVVVALTHRRRLVLVPAAVAAGAVFALLPPIASRLAHEVNLSDPTNSLATRVRLWGATLRMLRDHPVFGTGLSGFARSIGPYRNGQYAEELIYPHNILLNFWTETGLLGTAAFAWILAAGLRLSSTAWRHGPAAWRPLQLGVALALLAVVVHGLVDVPYWKNDLSLEFWTLLALSWAGVRWGASEVSHG